MKRAFSEAVADHLPARVLPVSTVPPRDFDLLIDSEYTQIRELLRPGRRQREEARAKIRTLLAMEAHVSEEVSISEMDVDRIEDAIRDEKTIPETFPRLTTLIAEHEGTGLEIVVRVDKKHGAPVRYVSGDDPEESAAVREVDLSKKYHYTATEIAEASGLTVPKSKAVRDEINLDSDPKCSHVFKHGNQHVQGYSEAAIVKLKEAVASMNLDEVWERRRPPGRRRR